MVLVELEIAERRCDIVRFPVVFLHHDEEARYDATLYRQPYPSHSWLAPAY